MSESAARQRLSLEGSYNIKPFIARTVRPHGLRHHNGWRLKTYSIVQEGMAMEWNAFDAGLAMVYASLPVPAVASSRPGVGFVIAHRARVADYIVLGWWDRENELPFRIVVRDHGEREATWRLARGGESFCVWDLQVVCAERDAYVATLMAGGSADDYLRRTTSAG